MPDHRIRLLKVVALFGCGGTERQFVNLGLSLDPDRFNLSFACLRRWGHFLGEIEARGIPVTEYPTRSFYSAGALGQHLRLAWRIMRDRVQVVHSYNFYGNMLAIPAAYLAGAPLIIASIRDRGVYLTPAQRRAQRFLCRFADCVLVNAESIRDWLVSDGYNASKVVVIPNGLDLSRYGIERQPGLRAPLGIAESAPVVTLLSRLTPMKGIEDFLDAAAIIAARRGDVRFLVVGEGQSSAHGRGPMAENTSYPARLSEQAARLGLSGRVMFTGYRADVPAILAETTVSVLPSLSEGLSNTVLESMAAGVPVVATRVGGTPEIVEDGVTGLLVPPSAPGALANAILRVLEHPELGAALAARARQSVEERFSTGRMVHDTHQLYCDLLTRKAARPGWRCRIGLAKRPLALAQGHTHD